LIIIVYCVYSVKSSPQSGETRETF
jgi:hypothetical protein